VAIQACFQVRLSPPGILLKIVVGLGLKEVGLNNGKAITNNVLSI
jgi:hypothetical protein